MALEPKPFQRAGIEAALQAFSRPMGSRRFLVADEVGLGKTVVASGVVRRMSEDHGKPLSVFYVCSNALLARQNLRRLAEFLPEGQRPAALSSVDRPSLMPTGQIPTHPRLRLYSLSPSTALARGGGRVEERAFAAALLDRVLPSRPAGLHAGLRLSASRERFKACFNDYRQRLDAREIGRDGFVVRFRDALRDLLKMKEGQHLPPRLIAEMEDFYRLSSTLRAALAIAALGAIKPDLVIFDEFQKFRDLLDPEGEESDEAAARLLQAIRGGKVGGPALLLLSATPYVPYRGRYEGADASPAADFHELVAFLAGDRGDVVKGIVAKAFADLGEELRKGIPDVGKVEALRLGLENELRPLICRTERSRVAAEGDRVETLRVNLVAHDVASFRGFAEALRDSHPEWAVPLWSSVPLPLQTLGQRYQAWRRADWSKGASAIGLKEIERDALRPMNPIPHPRLRALLQAMPKSQIALPWVSPSRPWWPLGGAWANQGQAVDGKLLIFSRYRASPAAIAGLVSYAIEATPGERRRGRGGTWEGLTKRSLLPANPERPGLLALFHPSPLLAGLDPLQGRTRTGLALRQTMFKQLTERLSKFGVKVSPHGPRAKHLLPWQMIAALEERAKLWSDSLTAWTVVIEGVAAESSDPAAGSRLKAMVDRWNEARAEDVSVLDDEEVRALASFALDAPGVVLARSLGRHWPDATTVGLAKTAGFCWHALRAYLDNPLFSEALGEGQDEHYPDALRRAVREGNLESVFDEHFWYVGQSGSGSWQERLEDLERAMRLRSGSTSLFESADRRFRLRCHAAMAMTEARAGGSDDGEPGDIPVRPDEVRLAFNSPFWPHVLATTSVGQEGLDFHPWCRAVAHWDPPAGPVALEQREGRITRHAGLNVRRALAKWSPAVEASPGESPWVALARKADAELADKTGLRPWWTADGKANVQRLLMTATGSEIEEIMSRLARERALYRLVLGMPDQADLVGLMMTREVGKIDPKLVCIDLMAMRG